MATITNEFRSELRERYRVAMRDSLGTRDDMTISDTMVAYLFAKDLMAGDAASFKAGYTADNAYLVARDAFPEADAERLAAMLGAES